MLEHSLHFVNMLFCCAAKNPPKLSVNAASASFKLYPSDDEHISSDFNKKGHI